MTIAIIYCLGIKLLIIILFNLDNKINILFDNFYEIINISTNILGKKIDSN